MSRIRRRRTFAVWLVLFHPSASDALRMGWRQWIETLDQERKPIPADLLAHIPPDLRGLQLTSRQLRDKEWVWTGVIRWRDRRDLQEALETILQGLPSAHDAHWVWMHLMEGNTLVYAGTAKGLAAASFAWSC